MLKSELKSTDLHFWIDMWRLGLDRKAHYSTREFKSNTWVGFFWGFACIDFNLWWWFFETGGMIATRLCCQKGRSFILWHYSVLICRIRKARGWRNWLLKTKKSFNVVQRMGLISSCTFLTTTPNRSGRSILGINGQDLWRGRPVLIRWPSLPLDRKFSQETVKSQASSKK